LTKPHVSIKNHDDLALPRIPEDLMQFIRRDSYSLLIKGYAGTGKTTLALTILNVLGVKKDFFYISTRLSPKQLFQYYPWLEGFLQQSTSPGTNMTRDHEMMSTFEDARLDEPESLFERITNQLMDIKSPIIIIDSWDAIASFMDREARLNNERVLQTWRERAGAKLIFISEQPTDATLDFIVDGIVELRQSYYNNIKMRQIFLQKLRGTRINRPCYLYTLENSIFHSFTPYKRITFETHKTEAPDLSDVSIRDSIQTGYPALDVSLGSGFPRKGVVLVELDSHVDMTIALVLLQKVVSNHILSGNPVVLQPFSWIEPSSILHFFEQSIPATKKGYLKVVSTGKNLNANQLLGTLVKMKQKYRNKVLLNIMSAESLHNLNRTRNVRETLLTILPPMLAHADLSIFLVPNSHPGTVDFISEVSNIHLRLLMINDALFLQPLVPSSNLFSLVLDWDSPMSLKAVV
jgi:KaiC/GvpD/RAD55 family RecA-like ATPase